jgi:cobalt-zinc-cadmium efflux system outer membrane protein
MRSGSGWMRWSCMITWVASAALLAGCAQYRVEPISAAGEAAALGTRSLNDPRLREFIAVGTALAGRRNKKAAWGLDRLTLAAVYYHPSLAIARAKLASAQAGVVTAAQLPNPLLNIAGFYNSTVPTPSPWSVGPMVDFIIDTFGKRPDRIAQASALATAARFDLTTAKWQLRSAVRTALLDLWAATERVRLTKESLKYQNQLISLLGQRLKVGQSSATEVTIQRISRDQAAIALSTARGEMAQARVELATAIGVPVHALDGVALSYAAFERPVAIGAKVTNGEFRRLALTRRSDVQSLLADYAAAGSALQLEITDQFPNMTLSPGYQFDQGSDKWQLSGSADLPVFNQNQGPIAQAVANRREAAARFMALQARIIGDIESAVASYRAATRTLDTADALLASARAHLHQVSQSFSAGAVGRVSLLAAQVELASIEIPRLDAVVKQRQAIGALEDALQQPLFDRAGSFLAPTGRREERPL